MSSDHKTMPAHIKRFPLYHEFWKRIYWQDKMVLLVICGETGSRKSGSAITIGKDFDLGQNGMPRFNAKHVVSKASDFVKIINSGLPKGSVIIFDDCGVENDNREFLTLRNRFVKKIMQTVRSNNFVIILTLPDLASLDVGSRRVMKGLLEMNENVESHDYAVGRFFWVQTNPRSGKPYFKYIRFKGEDNQYYRQDEIEIARPPEDIWAEYSSFKEKTKKEWYNSFETELSYMGDIVSGKMGLATTQNEDLQNCVLKHKEACFDFKKNRFIVGLVGEVLKKEGFVISDYKARQFVSLLNAKQDKGMLDSVIVKGVGDNSVN